MNPESFQLKLAGFIISVAGGVLGSCLSALIAGAFVVKFVLKPIGQPGPGDGLLLLVVLIVALIPGFTVGKAATVSMWNSLMARERTGGLLGGQQ
jgi:hypothetical protein